MKHYSKPFIILKKLQGALAKNIYLKLAPNVLQLNAVGDLKHEIINLKQCKYGAQNFEYRRNRQ